MFKLDPITEADRKARMANEPDISKKKEINDYGIESSWEEEDAILTAELQLEADIEESKNIINGDYDSTIGQDSDIYLD